MQGIHYRTNSLFPIAECDTILQNGAVLMLGTVFSLLFLLIHLQLLLRPANKQELFNLRHASARNVIERIFGVLKRRFRILHLAPEYNLNIQARIPAALCAIHNVIAKYDPGEGSLPENAAGDDNDYDNTNLTGTEPRDANVADKRDRIAEMMWQSYQQIRAEMDEGIDVIDDDDDDD